MTDEPRVMIDPLVADIFTAMASQSAATTNRVFDDYEATIAEWKERYLSL